MVVAFLEVVFIKEEFEDTKEVFRIRKLKDRKLNGRMKLVLKCLYQARKVTGHVYMCQGYQFCLFLQYFVGFWNCSDCVVYFLLLLHCQH
jgi:hypothetical protein